jgi:hypothetical protein
MKGLGGTSFSISSSETGTPVYAPNLGSHHDDGQVFIFRVDDCDNKRAFTDPNCGGYQFEHKANSLGFKN